MKNLSKLIGVIALVAVIGFSFAACDNGTTDTHTHQWGEWRSNATQHWKECNCGEEYGRANHTGTPNCSVCGYATGGVNLSLDGVWRGNRGVDDHVVTISSSTGVFTQISSMAVWQSAINKGYIKAGDQKFRNLRNIGGLIWTGEERYVEYNTSAPNVALSVYWENCTITLNTNGQSFVVNGVTYTKTTLSLDGNWQGDRGVDDHVVTISDSTGVFIQISSMAVWQDAVNKGYIKAGDQKFRNLRNISGLTWTGEERYVEYNTSAPNVALSVYWENCTITLNTNSQSFVVNSVTYTRR